jgi:hypothetical protein
MNQIRKNNDGFSAIETLLILIIIGLVGFVGWYVYQAKQTADKNTAISSSSQAAVSKPKLAKTYTNNKGGFSVQYPANWKLKAEPADSYAEVATLTSPKGTVLNLRADEGGKGGDCFPSPSDVPFRAGNTCSSVEYLSSEKLNVNNIYYSKLHKGSDGSPVFTYELADVVLTTNRFADSAGKPGYFIGVTESTEDSPVRLNEPVMGLYVSNVWLTVYDKSGKSYPYIYTYANGSTPDFLKSNDVKTIKEILRTLKVNPVKPTP